MTPASTTPPLPPRARAGTLAVTDDALLLRAWCARRDETALAALMEHHTGGRRAALHRRLQDPAQVEDAVQAVWITLTRKAASVRDPDRLVGWLHACAGQIALDILRAEASRRAAERAAGLALVAMATTAAPEDPVAELRSRLDAAIARVSLASREASLRHYLHGQSQTVAAAACGISENAFAKRVEYGLDQLRRLLGARRRPAGTAMVLALLAGEGRAAAGEPPPVSAITDPPGRPGQRVRDRHGHRHQPDRCHGGDGRRPHRHRRFRHHRGGGSTSPHVRDGHAWK